MSRAHVWTASEKHHRETMTKWVCFAHSVAFDQMNQSEACAGSERWLPSSIR